MFLEASYVTEPAMKMEDLLSYRDAVRRRYGCYLTAREQHYYKEARKLTRDQRKFVQETTELQDFTESVYQKRRRTARKNRKFKRKREKLRAEFQAHYARTRTVSYAPRPKHEERYITRELHARLIGPKALYPRFETGEALDSDAARMLHGMFQDKLSEE